MVFKRCIAIHTKQGEEFSDIDYDELFSKDENKIIWIVLRRQLVEKIVEVKIPFDNIAKIIE